MKLALGTVQFGLNYGISNANGKVSDHELSQLLRFATEAGITLLDTAQAYGDAESRLGKMGIASFQVISKLAPGITAATTRQAVQNSLQNLQKQQLYALMLHRSQDYSSELWQTLQVMQAEGLIKKCGVSVYSPSELETWFYNNPTPDIVQLPANLLDQRFLRTGWLDRLKEAGCEIHVRSVFLQGLLLMLPNQRPAKFSRFQEQLRPFDTFAANYNRLNLTWALQYHLPQVDKFVIGCCSSRELSEIVSAYQHAPLLDESQLNAFSTDDIELINPALWERL